MKSDVTIYTTTMCPVCQMVRQFLTNINVDYNEVNVDFRPIEMMKLIGKTKRLTVPQTNIHGKWVFGFNPEGILQALEQVMEFEEGR
ncbi:glutaredoxin [Gracilibacillus halotolerans]|uniref:Glutaredoxin n=1 Tax=Gracilibacillus halotolerans TaxID=74386 RepID=A0A841RTJ3_9BACI|nr:glutaredoxin family protein [Gracilibacillus halotolerans]MBB6514244.1 glutaredoxin [Gracilibacillus halotolerans]